MKKNVMLGIILTLLLTGMLILTFNIQPVRASGTIYIRADGGIDPPTAPISTVDNITYTFTDNIYDEIVVERSNIIIDGNGYTLQGSGSGNGFDLSGINNVTIKNTSIKNFDYGVHFYSSSYNTVSSNNVSSNGYLGIQLVYSSNCSVSGNNVRNNDYYGISLWDCSNCTVSGNNVTNHERGLWLDYSSNCVLRNNSMIDNSYNFGVSGKSLKHYVQDVDISNTVNGKPVYYLLNQNDLTVGPSTYPDIGYLGLVNSTNIKVVDLMLTNNLQGVLFSYTTDSTIKNITTNNNIYGIHLDNSSNCSVSGNIATNNWFAIRLDHSRVCLVSSNIATNNWYGIALSSSSRCSISGNNASNNTRSGIVLEESSKCLVSGNDANNNHERGIWLYGFSSRFVSNCSVSGNNASNNEYGIYLSHSGKYSVSENNVSNNEYGIWLKKSNNNTIYHNNFISNTVQVNTNGSINVWDDGYPSGGNYWSDYNSTDFYNGPNQDQLGGDGIGDTSYVIDENNQDNFPLMGMFSDFNATSEHHVQTICNSTISDFQYNGTAISFNVSGENDTTGFCRICIPTALMNVTYKVYVNDTEVSYNLLPCSNSTHGYLYFTYNHSTQEVVIIPEFPSIIILPLLMTIAMLTVVFTKKKIYWKKLET